MTTATGSLSLSKENLRITLADCATFRTWVGATTAAQALNRIHHEGLPPRTSGEEYTIEELNALRPYALLSTESFGSRHEAASTSFDYRDSGTIRCRLVQEVPQEIADDHGEIGRRFDNVVGGIMDDLAALSGQGGYLAIEGMDMPEPWTRTEDNRQATDGDFVQVDLLFEWGTG